MGIRSVASSMHHLQGIRAPTSLAASRLVGGVTIAMLFMGSTLVTPLYDVYASTYGLSVLGVGLLYAVYVVGNLIALLFLGRLSDQIGRRPVIALSIALAAMSTALYCFAQAPAWLFMARAVSGLAVGIGSGAATAWITELTPAKQRGDAASVMTSFNFVGLALGPVLTGGLVQYAPAPLHLPFTIYATLLVALLIALALTRETLTRTTGSGATLRPRLGVPQDVRSQFITPAAAGFASMALVGFYAALGPSTIQQALRVSNRATSSTIVATLFVAAALVIVATRKANPRTTLQLGLLTMPIGVGLLVAAQLGRSMSLMLLSSLVCGASAALDYRGGLAVANTLAPEDRRAEVASTYFVCCFLGNALPVIGVTALSQYSNPTVASIAFAILLTLIGIAAWVTIRRARSSNTEGP